MTITIVQVITTFCLTICSTVPGITCTFNCHVSFFVFTSAYFSNFTTVCWTSIRISTSFNGAIVSFPSSFTITYYRCFCFITITLNLNSFNCFVDIVSFYKFHAGMYHLCIHQYNDNISLYVGWIHMFLNFINYEPPLLQTKLHLLSAQVSPVHSSVQTHLCFSPSSWHRPIYIIKYHVHYKDHSYYRN